MSKPQPGEAATSVPGPWPTAQLVESLRLVSPSSAVDPAVHTPRRVANALAALGFTPVTAQRTFQVWRGRGLELRVALIPTAPDYCKSVGNVASVLADEYDTGELGILTIIANHTTEHEERQ